MLLDDLLSVSDRDSLADSKSISKAVQSTLKSNALDKTVKACYLRVSRRQYAGPKQERKPYGKEFTDSIATSETSSTCFVEDVGVDRSSHPSSSYLIDRQPPTASSSTVHTIFPTLASSSHVNTNVIKDVMIKRMRDFDKVRRKLAKGEVALEGSLLSSIGSISSSNQLFPSITLQPQNSLLSLTHHGKMGALIDMKDSYAYKWHRMREKRTMERVQKDARDEQQQTILAFRNISKQFDKKAIQQRHAEVKQRFEVEVTRQGQKNRANLKTAHELFSSKQKRDANRKAIDAQALRKTLEAGSELSKELIREERDLIRQHRLNLSMRKQLLTQSSDLTELDQNESSYLQPIEKRELQRTFSASSSSSFMFNIPNELSNKLKNAKSLSAFNEAKKEIKDYQEQIYADKLKAIAVQKHMAQRNAKSRGSPLRLNVLRASLLFTEGSNEDKDGYDEDDDHLTFDDTDDDNSTLQLSAR